MRFPALLVVLVLGVLAWPRLGHAEKIKTNQSTKLYSRAGEQSPVVLKVKSGQIMTLLAKDGRWLKVRVAGRTGWIPRSKVDMPDDDEEIARNTRRRPFVDGRSTKRGFGGEGGPDDRIGADAVGDGDSDDAKPSKPSKPDKADDDAPKPRGKKPAKPEADDDAAETDAKPRGKKSAKPTKSSDDDDEDPIAKKGAKADKADKADKAAKADKADDDADAGDDAKAPPRPMAHVSKATAAYNEPSSTSDESFTAQPRTALYIVEESGKWTFVENDEGDAGYVLTSKLDVDAPDAGPRHRAIDLRGRLGVALIRQSVSTPGGAVTLPDNYGASSSSVTVALGGTVMYPYKKRYWLGGELAYDFDKAEPGIAYMGTTTAFTFHNLNLRGAFGYDLQNQRGMIVFGRLGLHFDSFQVDNVTDLTKNTAKLPSQIIIAPTLGVALAIPRLGKQTALTVSLDTILAGSSVSQTKNLEDGTNPSAKALYLGGILTYHWKPKLDLQLTYDLAYTSLSFEGLPPATSMRGHTGTGPSSGSDFNNTLSFGVAYGL